MDINRFEQMFDKISKIGEKNKGVTRLAYSEEEKKAKDLFMKACVNAGMEVRMDACGNVFARRHGENPSLPPVATGSHLDTVMQGGKFDGTIGVLAGLEVVRSLNENNIKTLHPIELICFAAEESSRFSVSTLGSKLLTGKIKRESLKKLVDRHGISIGDAFSSVGLDVERVANYVQNAVRYKAFLEMHIEQGPLLETTKDSIGIVTGIAAPTRYKVTFYGKASHSGATSMELRKDALLGSSELALALEAITKKEAEFGSVGTVGVMDVLPGAMNVVPGQVNMQIDIRSTSMESKERIIEELFQEMDHIKQRRNLGLEWEKLSHETPVLLDKEIIQLLRDTCESSDLGYQLMASGAGHDVMNMADVCPSGLIFVPSIDGLSHHPDEYTPLPDIQTGIAVLEKAILDLAIKQ